MNVENQKHRALSLPFIYRQENVKRSGLNIILGVRVTCNSQSHSLEIRAGRHGRRKEHVAQLRLLVSPESRGGPPLLGMLRHNRSRATIVCRLHNLSKTYSEKRERMTHTER